MSKDPKTAERFAVEAMATAIGALRALKRDGDLLDTVINQLLTAIDKFDPRCEHEWIAARSPHGGVDATCKKCGVTRYVQ